MRTFIIALLTVTLLGNSAHARLLLDTPNHQAPEAKKSPAKPQKIRVEMGVNMGLVQELIVTCPNAETAIISFSNAEQVYCSPKGCTADSRKALRHVCGSDGIQDAVAAQ